MKKEEVQEKVYKEMQKRMTANQFMTNSQQENARIMQQILDENPEWGYKIIINCEGYFVLTSRQ